MEVARLTPSSAPRFGIVADDLTGALDVASSFADVGFSVSLVLDRRSICDDQILVVTTNSRHDSFSSARRKVHKAVRFFERRACRLIYKKIDSTCQGNIAAEVEAALEASIQSKAIICPANLTQQRYVKDGVLHVRGQNTLNLYELLQSQSSWQITGVGYPLSSQKLSRAILDANPIVIADATKQSDLDCLANLGLDDGNQVLLVGSAGLGNRVAQLLAKRYNVTASRRECVRTSLVESTRRPILLMIGSRNEVTQNQVTSIVEHSTAKRVDCSRTGAAKARRLIRQNHNVLVTVPIRLDSAKRIQTSLGHFVSLINADRLAGIVLSGGDTALEVCGKLKLRSISVRGELLPGLAWGRIVGGIADGIAVCTKPGGFGNAPSLIQAVEMLSAIAGEKNDE